VNTAADLALIGALAAVWLAAGLLADGLPAARTAAELRRRATLLSVLAGSGVAVFVAIPMVAATVLGASSAPSAALLATVPAMVVLASTVRRLGQVRRGAGAFATAPQAPVPPGLRAAAAHPLVAAPLQVTGLAALIGIPIAGGLVTIPGADAAGIAITVVGLAVVAIGVRHALRHSRLAVRAVAPLTRASKQIARIP
jgi:hypothetical protein